MIPKLEVPLSSQIALSFFLRIFHESDEIDGHDSRKETCLLIIHLTRHLHAPISIEKLARDVYPKSVIRLL